ncbi:hypothetical protein A2U01_0084178, partial [Trifolium medium]|nr:hypothetical protein [Trifolium medium]
MPRLVEIEMNRK